MGDFITIEKDAVWACSTEVLGDAISEGIYKQVGCIRTNYVYSEYTTHSMEAVLQSVQGDFLAVEQHRGAAIMALIQDPKMLELIEAELKRYEECEDDNEYGFILQQSIKYDTEDLSSESYRKGLEAADGTEVEDE